MTDYRFPSLRDLKPSAFKLYYYFLYRSELDGTDTISIPLVELGHESGLQPYRAAMYGKQHGNDGQVRNALLELVRHGFIELSETGRGRKANAYRIKK